MEDYEIINKYEYISFDIFDTLVTRNLVDNKDVFKFVQEYYNLNYNNRKEKDFYKKRILAEKEARMHSLNEEISIEEIYSFLDIDINEKNILFEIEKELEYKLCEKNKCGYQLYKYAFSKNKKIIIISDMYLDRETIEKILKKNDIQYYKLFISSESKLTKSTGNLYKFVLNELKINPKNMLHIGDNLKSDYLNPKKLGINCIRIKNKKIKNIKEFGDKENKIYNIIEKFINNKIGDNKEYFWNKGYECFGPVLYSYIKWLEENFKKQKYDNILFLSRDGYLMQKAFKIINSDIETKYFYASRRALIVPTIHKYKDLSEILENNSFPKKMKIESFFKKIGIDKDNEILNKCGYELDKYIKAEELRDFIKDIPVELKNEIYSNSKKEYNNFMLYLTKNKIKNKIAIIDIGWNGNMQQALCNMLNNISDNKEIDGYYMGVNPNSDKKDKYKMHGFLFEKNREELYLKEKYFNALFELIFLGHHGSVKRYGDNSIEFYDYEYENDETKDLIYSFQDGALTFIKDFEQAEISKYIRINENVGFYNMSCLGNYPDKTDVNEFGKLSFYDEEISKLVDNKNLGYYIIHIKQLKNDFNYSKWKPGFLKNLFKVKFDYLKFINLLYKIYKKNNNM